MNNAIQNTIAIVLMLLAAYWLADRFVPGATAELRSVVMEHRDWSESAIAADPVGYLEWTEENLKRNKDVFARTILQLRQSTGPLSAQIAERQDHLARTSALLGQGKTVYKAALDKAAKGETVGPIKFAGRTYESVELLRTQIELLFMEEKSDKALTSRLESTLKQLTQRSHGMMAKQAELEVALNSIAPQIALAKAEQIAGELDEIVARTRDINSGVLLTSTRMLTDIGPVGTADELMTSVQGELAAKIASPEGFEEFLAQ